VKGKYAATNEHAKGGEKERDTVRITNCKVWFFLKQDDGGDAQVRILPSRTKGIRGPWGDKTKEKKKKESYSNWGYVQKQNLAYESKMQGRSRYQAKVSGGGG